MTRFFERLLAVGVATTLMALAVPAAAGAAIGPGSKFTLMPPYHDVAAENHCSGLCLAHTGAERGELHAGVLGEGGTALSALTLFHDLDEAARSIVYTVEFHQQFGQYMLGDVLLEVSAVDDACNCSARTSIPLPPPSPGQQDVTVTFTLAGDLAPDEIRVTTAVVIPPLRNPAVFVAGSVNSIHGEVS